MAPSKDHARTNGSAKTKADAGDATSRKPADVAPQPSPDSPKRQGDKYEGAVREASKR